MRIIASWSGSHGPPNTSTRARSVALAGELPSVSLPATTCDGRPNAEPMASAFPGSRRGHGRPSNKQRDKTTRTSALTEITPYKWLADYNIPGVDGLALHHLYRAMAWLCEELPADQQGGPRPLP